MIHLAHGLSFDAQAAAVQKFAFLARSGAGKTYAAGVLAEGFIKEGVQIVVLDNVGVWYGLRLAKDGKGEGAQIPVFGGIHGDLSLSPASGALVAELVVARNLSVVLDISDMRKGRQREFVTSFAEEFFHQKKSNRSPVHLFFEEAQEVAPQNPQKGEEKMLGAMEDLARIGRNFGIGWSVISQRPQSIHKSVLNQAECLVVLQTNGAHERKALKEWTKGKVSSEDLNDDVIDDALPNLEVGEAFIWSPQWLRTFRRLMISAKKTYDASSTPTSSTPNATPKPLDDIDLDVLRKEMASFEHEAEQSDPKRLKARIAELEKQVAAEHNGHDYWTKVREENTSFRDLVKQCRAELNAAETANNALLAKISSIEHALNGVQVLAASVADGLKKPLAEAREVPLKMARPPNLQWIAAALPTGVAINEQTGEVGGTPTAVTVPRMETIGLKKGARTMLDVLRWRDPKGLTRAQLATLSGLAPTSGTFSSYLSSMRTLGLIDEVSPLIGLTDKGRALAGPPKHTNVGGVRAMWLSKMKLGERRMLEALVDKNAPGFRRSDLARAAGLDPNSGTFSSYLSTLRRNGLIFENAGVICAVEELLA